MYFNDPYLTDIINGFEKADEVDSVVLGGSRSTGENDEKSDFDIYVYLCADLSDEKKAAIVTPHCSVSEIGNRYWEPEDNCIMKDGIGLDIIYRKVEDFERYLKYVIEGCNAFNGYTTCFWHNIRNSVVLFDKSERFTALQKKVDIPYPEKLRENIISKNRKLLHSVLPSYDLQLKKAQERGDINSVQHRTTEFLASYFDILFALNRLTHPGEKRLIQLCKKQCAILPENFEENITALIRAVSDGGSYEAAQRIVEELDKVLES